MLFGTLFEGEVSYFNQWKKDILLSIGMTFRMTLLISVLTTDPFTSIQNRFNII